jgi:hypothetical protein
VDASHLLGEIAAYVGFALLGSIGLLMVEIPSTFVGSEIQRYQGRGSHYDFAVD